MKKVSVLLLILLLACSSKTEPKKTLEETILQYNEELGIVQKAYRLWFDRSTAKFETLLDFNTFQSLNKINSSISYSKSCQDTIRNSILILGTKLTEYGNELNEFIPKQNDKTDFAVKWLETKEDILRTMAYDMESINIYLKLFLFVQKQYSNYEIVDNTILFEDDDLLEQYYSVVEELNRVDEISSKQTDLRMKVFEDYTKLVNSVKNY